MTPSILEEKLERLRVRGVADPLRERIRTLVVDGAPAALARLSPPRLARDWGVRPLAVLDAFLAGTREGLFELEWNLRCPACTGATAHAGHLDELKGHVSCPVCAVDGEATFDRSVEIVWHPHGAVRDVSGADPLEVFMAQARPEPVARLVVAPRGLAEVQVRLQAGNYHLLVPGTMMVRGLGVAPADAASAAAEPALFDVHFDGTLLARGDWQRPEGDYRLRVHNDSEAERVFLLTRVADAPFVSGADLAAHQGFRDLFSTELIRTDESFGIRSQAFVFTDLKGSTALYERIGDSQAYALVRDHFRVMLEQVRVHGGSVVKTIGDAVMATFLTGEAGVAFALDTLAAFDAFNETRAHPDDVIVKIGVHKGPCIAVTLNDRIDYFGRTVNMAARIQGKSKGGDVVLSLPVLAERGVRELLETVPWAQEPFSTELKGIEGQQRLVRLVPAE